jgi:hypothetical protein
VPSLSFVFLALRDDSPALGVKALAIRLVFEEFIVAGLLRARTQPTKLAAVPARGVLLPAKSAQETQVLRDVAFGGLDLLQNGSLCTGSVVEGGVSECQENTQKRGQLTSAGLLGLVGLLLLHQACSLLVYTHTDESKSKTEESSTTGDGEGRIQGGENEIPKIENVVLLPARTLRRCSAQCSRISSDQVSFDSAPSRQSCRHRGSKLE